MKRVLIALSALLFANYATADQATVIANLADASSCDAAHFRHLAADSSVSCEACSKATFLDTSGHGYKFSLEDSNGGGGDHPACCSTESDKVCRALMSAYKAGCQAQGDHGIGGTCAA